MPYDRKTELLWNYIGIAQFSDLSKFWGQGPAFIGSQPTDPQMPDTSSTIKGESDGGDVPARNVMPSETISLSGTSSSASPGEFPNPDGDSPAHVSSAHVVPLMASAHATPNSFPMMGGARVSHEETTHHIHHAAQSTDQPANAPTILNPTGPDEPIYVEPKIYGPSEVHMQGVIIGGGSSQTNVVIAEDGSQIHGWSDLGSETIGNLIDQVRAPDIDNPFHLSVDYVSGNLTSLTTLIQLNTIYDNDVNQNITSISAASHSLIGDTNVGQTIDSGGNHAFNAATLVGNQALEGYDVLVVTGDLTKINKVMQVNLIVDEDVNHNISNGDINMPYGTATSVWDAAIQSGGNVQVNIGFIVDQQSGAVYLVGGFYGSTHSVDQLNVLSDADLNDILQLFHAQEGNGFLDFSALGAIVSGGNSQSNTAGFTENGDGTGHDGPPPLSDLTSLLYFAGLHPGDGDVKVLFVDGDYTIINLVVQINVINDADHNTQLATANGAMGSLEAPPQPEPEEETPATDAAAGDGSGTAPTDTHEGAAGTDPTTTGDTDQTHTAAPDDTSQVPTGETTPPATEAADTTDDSSTNSGDDNLPIYADHGNLNYDQITTSGGNQAGNQATLIDGGNGPQVVIVQGSYHEYNEIYQVNILFDTDHNRITSTMNADAPHPGGSDSGVLDTTHVVSADDVLHKMMS